MLRIQLLFSMCSSIRKLPPNRANGIAVFESSAVVPNSYSVSSIRRKSTNRATRLQSGKKLLLSYGPVYKIILDTFQERRINCFRIDGRLTHFP